MIAERSVAEGSPSSASESTTVLVEPDETPAAGRVLVVDDEARNREIVHAVLLADGYSVAEAGDGVEALAMVAAEPFDVIVLDVRMPGMDGLEMCRRLKADKATVMIPVLIVTAHDSRDERLRGIEAGASDFLAKPLDLTELRLRVLNAAASKKLYDELQAEYARVVELERLRDGLVHMIAHDIKSPLTAVYGNLDLLKTYSAEKLDPETTECVDDALEGRGWLSG